MIINVSQGYDKCFIEVSEKPVNNGFYLLKVFDDNEPAISIELLQSSYAIDLLQNRENAACLCGDGSTDDIWNRPNRKDLTKAVYFGTINERE